jgi:hypothetical protein
LAAPRKANLVGERDLYRHVSGRSRPSRWPPEPEKILRSINDGRFRLQRIGAWSLMRRASDRVSHPTGDYHATRVIAVRGSVIDIAVPSGEVPAIK